MDLADIRANLGEQVCHEFIYGLKYSLLCLIYLKHAELALVTKYLKCLNLRFEELDLLALYILDKSTLENLLKSVLSCCDLLLDLLYEIIFLFQIDRCINDPL